MSSPYDQADDGLRTLSQREGRRATARGPHEGVPRHLEVPLRSWLHRELTPDLEQDIALRMEIVRSPKVGVRRGGLRPLADQDGLDLLDVADLALRLDPTIAEELEDLDADTEDIRAAEDASAIFADVPEAADQLDRILAAGNSVYRVARHARPLRLIQPLDPTVTTVVAGAIEEAEATAGSYLHDAWVAAYAREPDPDGAYRDAVRAVERAIAPVVSGTNPQPTLGTALRTLGQDPGGFELALVDDQDIGSIDPFVAMLRRLWQGQRSRHGGGPYSRDQTVVEAKAAVQLAAVCVQWLTDGVLRRRREEPGTP